MAVKYACKDVFIGNFIYTAHSYTRQLNACFIVDYLHAEMIPLFFLIKFVFNVDPQWLLCGKLLVPKSYDTHLHAYAFQQDSDWTVIQPGHIMDFQPLDINNINAVLYITLRNV